MLLNHMTRRVSLVAILCLAFMASARADDLRLRAELALEIDLKQSSTCPITCTVIITNKGDRSFAYWCGGPGLYPAASVVTATIKDAAGKVLPVQVTNGQYEQGSGTPKVIPAGKEVRVPIAFRLPQAGPYTVSFASPLGWCESKGQKIIFWPAMQLASPVAIEVVDENTLVQERVDELLQNVRAGSEFAIHVAAQYPVEPLLDKLVSDLLSVKPLVVASAARVLEECEKRPRGVDRVVSQAISRRLDWAVRYAKRNISIIVNEQYKLNRRSLDRLGWLAAELGTDVALEGVLVLANSEHTPPNIVHHLGKFRQERAMQALAKFTTHFSAERRFNAASYLAKNHNDAGLDILLNSARNEQDPYSDSALSALRNFPDNSDAEQVLREASQSKIPRRKEQAALFLQDFLRARRNRSPNKEQPQGPATPDQLR